MSSCQQTRIVVRSFVKVKTYSDLIVPKQDTHDKLDEPVRWVLYVVKMSSHNLETLSTDPICTSSIR
jgi:hypothetical protein